MNGKWQVREMDALARGMSDGGGGRVSEQGVGGGDTEAVCECRRRRVREEVSNMGYRTEMTGWGMRGLRRSGGI